LTVAKGTVINDSYVTTHQGELGGSSKFAVTGLALGLAGAPLTVAGNATVPLAWKYNGAAVEMWRTVTFTVNNTAYPVTVPDGASLTAEQRAALEAFLAAPSGSLSGVTWAELSSISEDKSPSAITVATLTVTFVPGNGNGNITRETVSGGTVTLPENPEKNGYDFGGWFTGENGTGTAFTAATAVTGAITVHAKWTESVSEPADPPIGSETPEEAADPLAGIQFKAGASLPESAWQSKSGQGTASQTWNLKVRDLRYVYFGVKKSADQTVTVQSADWQTPESTTPVTAENEPANGAIDGGDPLTASDTLAVFKVDANKVHDGKSAGSTIHEYYDTQFEGDDFQFTLAVSGGGTVTVNLRADVTLDNALFVVNTTTGVLSRVSGIKQFNAITEQTLNSVTWYDGTGGTEDWTGTSLLDMLVWFDTHYAAAGGQSYASPNAYVQGGEYLIRVVEDALIPVVILTMPVGDATTKLRLRGTGGERKIASDGTELLQTRYFNTAHQTGSDTSATINKPSTASLKANTGLFVMRRGVLQLENHITFQGNALYNNQKYYSYLLQVHLGTLIMKDGSAVKGHVRSDKESYGYMSIYLAGNGTPWSWFLMEGGEISDHTGVGSVIRFEAIAHATASPVNRFQKTGGTIGGNESNRILFGSSLTTNADKCVFTIVPPGEVDESKNKLLGTGNMSLPIVGATVALPF
jgi:uncharacterized repeat protein (TIGR02543 family)